MKRFLLNSRLLSKFNIELDRYLIFSPDNNECATGTHKCSADAVCNNIKGSYNCTCNPGYYGHGRDCQGEVKKQTNIKTNISNLGSNDTQGSSQKKIMTEAMSTVKFPS